MNAQFSNGYLLVIWIQPYQEVVGRESCGGIDKEDDIILSTYIYHIQIHEYLVAICKQQNWPLDNSVL